NDRFGLLGHLVDCAMPVINYLLGMPKSPTRVRCSVTGVGRSGGVIARDRASETGVGDRARKAAIPDSLKLAVPAGARHPHFKLDIRIGGGFDHAGDPAKSGQVFEKSPAARRGCERA